jgi:hypothetical protein
MNLRKVSGDSGAHLDRIDRYEPANIFVLIGDGVLDRPRHSNGWRRRRRGLLLALTAAGNRHNRQK